MGVMRFTVPDPNCLSEEAISRAYVMGLDCIPTPSEKRLEYDQLIIEREIDESGNLHIPWDVDGFGQLLLSTASLMERDQPYLLPLELARGTVNRMRSKAEIWRMSGLDFPQDFEGRIREIYSAFSHAALAQKDPEDASHKAQACLRSASQMVVDLGTEYASRILRLRHEESPHLHTLLIGKLGDMKMPDNADPMFGAAFNTAISSFSWRIVQPTPTEFAWQLFDKHMQICKRHGHRIFGGPLLQIDRSVMPDWLYEVEDDFDTLAHHVRRYIQATVTRYRDRVQAWHVAAGTNMQGSLNLSDEQRLRLTVQAVETTRHLDPKKPLIVSVGQPWGEYMTDGTHHLPPFHFAETLTRAELGIAGLGLEINYGYWPGGTSPRDILEIGHHIDLWSTLGLPLIVFVTAPSSTARDPLALQTAGRPLPHAGADGVTPQSQRELIERLFPVLLAKPAVHGVAWDQVFDSCSHKFPNAGLFDADDRPKPALSAVLGILRDHLS